MAAKYNPAAPPKKVRTDRPGDSKKPYLNPFATPVRAAHKTLPGEQRNKNV